MIGGLPEVMPWIDRHLHVDLAQRLAGHVDVDVGSSTPDDVLAAVRPIIEEDDRRREREVLDRIVAGTGRAGRGAAGLEEVLEALNERRVETLAFEPNFDEPAVSCPRCGWLGPERVARCPADGSETAKRESILETAVERTLAQSAEVLVIRHHPDLGPLGRIGAALRF